jgi:hypothetical protein
MIRNGTDKKEEKIKDEKQRGKKKQVAEIEEKEQRKNCKKQNKAK